jgi:hypothetical protein
MNALGGCYNDALYAASPRGNMRIVRVLVDQGTKVHVWDGAYGNAVCVAISRKDHDVSGLLLDKGFRYNDEQQDAFGCSRALSAASYDTCVVLSKIWTAGIDAVDSH